MKIIGTREEIEKLRRACDRVSYSCIDCCLTSFCNQEICIEVSKEKMYHIEKTKNLDFDISLPTLLIPKGK